MYNYILTYLLNDRMNSYKKNIICIYYEIKQIEQFLALLKSTTVVRSSIKYIVSSNIFFFKFLYFLRVIVSILISSFELHSSKLRSWNELLQMKLIYVVGLISILYMYIYKHFFLFRSIRTNWATRKPPANRNDGELLFFILKQKSTQFITTSPLSPLKLIFCCSF